MTKVKMMKQSKKQQASQAPLLRFSPTAWAKLLFLRDYGDTEVGGFGVASSSDLLFIDDVQLVRQHCTYSNVDFEDESVADYFDQQVDAGGQPAQFARIWIHTHPGNCPQPSRIDEDTFDRVFGQADWAVMFILARGGRTYARIRYNRGPSAEIELRTQVDFSHPFEASDELAWEVEYHENVSAYDMLDTTAFTTGK